MQATPPPQPSVTQDLDLDSRLNASSQWVQDPDWPTCSVSITLANMPFRVKLLHRENRDGRSVLELDFDFLQEREEDRQSVNLRQFGGPFRIAMKVGSYTGRIYRLTLESTDLDTASADPVLDGLRACFRQFLESPQATLGQKAMLTSMGHLLETFLPEVLSQLPDPA
jgi:hypothetical protein